MSRTRASRWGVCCALLVAVTCCHTPTKQEQMEAAHKDLVNEMIEVQRCEAESGYASGRCADLRGSYDRDLAAFRAKYGR